MLVAPDLVLTAAHCVVLEGWPSPPAGAVNPVTQSLVRAAASYVHPRFQKCRPAGEKYAGNAGVDLAMVRLVLPLEGVPTASLVPVGVRPAAPIGGELDYVGFGAPDLQRRYGRFILDAVTDEGAVTATGADAGICPGDSGGALYLGRAETVDDVGQVLGIVSSQPFGKTAYGNCGVGNTALFSDLSAPDNRAFVDRVMAGVEPTFTMADIPVCCAPGDVAGSETTEQCCGDEGEWSSCAPSEPPKAESPAESP